MEAYNDQRRGAATVALGLAQGSYELALAYAGTRRQFAGGAIGDFEASAGSWPTWPSCEVRGHNAG